jgi:hypothetical protein
MTITLNFTTIFAWIGGLVCAVVTLWVLGWVIWGIRGAGELLGIWDSLGRGIRAISSRISSRIARFRAWLAEL